MELCVKMSATPASVASAASVGVNTPITIHNISKNVVSSTPRVATVTVPQRQQSLAAGGEGRTATTTAVPNQLPCTPTSRSIIPKVLLKAVPKANKKDSKTFILRNIDSEKLSVSGLKNVIRNQLKEEVISGEFDVGLMQGSSVVNIRTVEDLRDVWIDVRRGGRVLLWCDALKEVHPTKSSCNRRRRLENQSDSDDEDCSTSRSKRKKSVSKERQDEVQSAVDELKEKHKAVFTTMQYRIWAEMIILGLHASYDEPPRSTMFQRAGGKEALRKKSENASDSVVQVVSQALATALTPNPTSLSSSPAKLIENRSKCYKQLREINDLKSSGVLSQEEYEKEKLVVMEVLRTLSPVSKE